MKKIFALIMASALVAVSLASCGGKYTEGGKFKKGQVADGNYVNEAVGFGIKLPEGFVVSETKDLPAVEAVSYELLAKDENSNVICITSQKTEKKQNVETVAKNSLEDMKEHYEAGGYVVNDSKLADIKIGGNTYKAYSIDYTVGEEEAAVSFEQYAVFVVCENSVVTIAYTGKDGETEKFIKDNMFKA